MQKYQTYYAKSPEKSVTNCFRMNAIFTESVWVIQVDVEIKVGLYLEMTKFFINKKVLLLESARSIPSALDAPGMSTWKGGDIPVLVLAEGGGEQGWYSCPRIWLGYPLFFQKVPGTRSHGVVHPRKGPGTRDQGYSLPLGKDLGPKTKDQ